MKIRVKEGQCYVGTSTLSLPVKCTLENATKLLDRHLGLPKDKGVVYI